VAVATDLAAAKGAPLDGAELSRVMHVSQERGEQLAASLQVESFLHEGEAASPTRVRVATGEAEPDDITEAVRHKRSS
jgi:glutamate formiminotransferase